jgi:hypothetical protein
MQLGMSLPSQDKQIAPIEIRKDIFNLEAAIRNLPDSKEGDYLPLKHTFAPGVYAREIFIPAGEVLVGKIHKHAHINILVSGRVTVVTEHNGKEELIGPLTMVSLPATKRAVYAHEDTIWITIHLTDETDLEKIEEEVIAKDYISLDSPEELLALTEDIL